MNPKFDFRPVRSSNIAHVAYDSGSRVLAVKFNSGLEYRYADVPAEKHAGLMSAPSAGSYLVRHIQGHHSFTRV